MTDPLLPPDLPDEKDAKKREKEQRRLEAELGDLSRFDRVSEMTVVRVAERHELPVKFVSNSFMHCLNALAIVR